jgi:hypothetical protein
MANITNTPIGVCSCSFALFEANIVRHCSLFADNVRLPRKDSADTNTRRAKDKLSDEPPDGSQTEAAT